MPEEAAHDPSLQTWSWSTIEVVSPRPGIERQAIDGHRQSVVRYRYEPGSVFPEHAHAEEQVTLVLRGRLLFQVGDQQIELGAGDGAIIPANVPHGAAVLGDETVETYNVLSPRRTEHPTGRASPPPK